MNKAQIYNQLQEVFTTTFGREIALSDSTQAAQIPDWDSIRNIRLIVGIEKKFKIRFHLGELENSLLLGDWVSLIQKHLQNEQ